MQAITLIFSRICPARHISHIEEVADGRLQTIHYISSRFYGRQHKYQNISCPEYHGSILLAQVTSKLHRKAGHSVD
jgi:hypothetical protein